MCPPSRPRPSARRFHGSGSPRRSRPSARTPRGSGAPSRPARRRRRRRVPRVRTPLRAARREAMRSARRGRPPPRPGWSPRRRRPVSISTSNPISTPARSAAADTPSRHLQRVQADGDAASLGKRRQPVQLPLAHDRIADEDVADAPVDHDLRLPELRHLDADCSSLDLKPGDLRQLVRLRVRTERLAGLGGDHRRAADVGPHDADVDNDARACRSRAWQAPRGVPCRRPLWSSLLLDSVDAGEDGCEVIGDGRCRGLDVLPRDRLDDRRVRLRATALRRLAVAGDLELRAPGRGGAIAAPHPTAGRRAQGASFARESW